MSVAAATSTAPSCEAKLPVFPQARVPVAAPKDANEAGGKVEACAKATAQRSSSDNRGYGQGDSSCSELEPSEESIRQIINVERRKTSIEGRAAEEGCPLGIMSEGSLAGAYNGNNCSGDQGTNNLTMYNNRSGFASCYSVVSAASISSGGSTLVSEHSARSVQTEENDPSSVLDSSINNNDKECSSSRGNSVQNSIQSAKQNVVCVTNNTRSEQINTYTSAASSSLCQQQRRGKHHDPLTLSVASEASSITTDGRATSSTTERIEVRNDGANNNNNNNNHLHHARNDTASLLMLRNNNPENPAPESLLSSNHLDTKVLHVEGVGEIIKSSHLPSSLVNAATVSVPYWKRGKSRVSPLHQLHQVERERKSTDIDELEFGGLGLLTAVSSPTDPACANHREDWREDEDGSSPLEKTSLGLKPTRGFLEINSRVGAEKSFHDCCENKSAECRCRYEAMFARTRSVINNESGLLPAAETRTASDQFDADTQNSDGRNKGRQSLCRRRHRRDSNSLGVQYMSEGDDEVELRGDSSTTSPLLLMMDSRGRVQHGRGATYERQSSRSTLKPAATRRGSLSNSQASQNSHQSMHASLAAPPPLAPTPPLAPSSASSMHHKHKDMGSNAGLVHARAFGGGDLAAPLELTAPACYVVGSSAPLVDVEPYSGCASVHSHHSSPNSPSPPMHYVCKSSNGSSPSLDATARGSDKNLKHADEERESNNDGGEENASERRNEKTISYVKHHQAPNVCVCACHSACSSYHDCACMCCGHAPTVSTAGNSNSVLGVGISSAVNSTSSNGNAALPLRSSPSHMKNFQSSTNSTRGCNPPIREAGSTSPPPSFSPYVSPRGPFYGAFGYGSPLHGGEGEEDTTNTSSKIAAPALNINGDANAYVARGRASSLSVLGGATIKKFSGTVSGTSPCHSPGSLAASTTSEVSLAASPSPSHSQSPSSLLLSPFASLKRWVPTSEYEVFRAESAILSPIRPLISQFVCAGLNTISTVHPKVPSEEYDAYENEKVKRKEEGATGEERKSGREGEEGDTANHAPVLCPPPPFLLDDPVLASSSLRGGGEGNKEPHLMRSEERGTHIIENFTFGGDPSPLSPDCRSLMHEHGEEETEEVRENPPPPLTSSFASATRARAVSLASSSRDIFNASGSAIIALARRMTPHLGPAKPPIITSISAYATPLTKNTFGDTLTHANGGAIEERRDTAHSSYAHTYTCETPRGSLFGDAGPAMGGERDSGYFAANGCTSICKAATNDDDNDNKLTNEERDAEIETSSFAWPTKFLSPGATPEASCLSPPSGTHVIRSPIDNSIEVGGKDSSAGTRSRALSLSTLFSRGGGGAKGSEGDTPAARASSLSVSGQRQLLSPEGQHHQPQVPPMQSKVLPPLPSEDYKIIVCVHGCYGGLGQWLPLWQEFAEKADVYAFDLPGFARSERPSDVPFCGSSSAKNKSAQTAIDWFHTYFDRWFAAMKFPKKVTIIAHSFGGYLFALYSKKRPDLFEHVFLADPWGVRSYDPARDNAPLPRTVKALLWSFYTLESGMHTVIKAAGPIGPRLIPWVRPELGDSWGKTHSDGNTIYDYLYQCNANKQAIGESGFRTCAVGPACPQIPLRTKLLEEEEVVKEEGDSTAQKPPRVQCERRKEEGYPRNNQAFKLSWVFGMKSRFNNRDALDTHKALLAQGISGTYDVVPDAGHQIMSDNPASLSAIVLHHMGLKPDPSRDEEALKIFVEEAVAECTKLCFKI